MNKRDTDVNNSDDDRFGLMDGLIASKAGAKNIRIHSEQLFPRRGSIHPYFVLRTQLKGEKLTKKPLTTTKILVLFWHWLCGIRNESQCLIENRTLSVLFVYTKCLFSV